MKKWLIKGAIQPIYLVLGLSDFWFKQAKWVSY